MEQGFGFATVEPEAHFVQVGCQMLCGDFVPRPHDAALEQAESGFDGISVDIPHDVDPVAVIDRFVPRSRYSAPLHSERVGCEIVRNNHVHIFTDVFADKLSNRRGFNVGGMKKPQFSVTLADSDHDLFLRVSPRISLPPRSAATYVGLIHLDNSSQLFPATLNHCGTDAMAEVPCGLVPADPEHPLNLASGNALLRLADNKRGEKPLRQRQVGIVEYAASGDAELCLAIDTPQNGFAPLYADDFLLAAFRAGGAIGPAQGFKVLTALDFAVKAGHKVRKVKTRNGNIANSRHNQAPMTKKRKRKTDREVLKELFPPEVVAEVDMIVEELDAPPRLENPITIGKKKRLPKPWTPKWIDEKNRRGE